MRMGRYWEGDRIFRRKLLKRLRCGARSADFEAMNMNTSIVKDNPRISYLVLFVMLIIPAISLDLLALTTNFSSSPGVTGSVVAISRVGIIILTVWYSLRVGFGWCLAGVLSISTLLPLMPWISYIILITRRLKTQEKADAPSLEEEENKTIEATKDAVQETPAMRF
jgi:hypothetical protein